ncbi:MAG: hypothetical protein Hyperionvirus24_22 [Hyperionvirus sp.]|uniref:Uncharacterized protein n=1 Tax=Hyperionvirus sp. TaxID=2487770 RepID=A0A3G5AB08_9VIRU|nr:MAG: hypothetical protein Hyperionvirus24_22 [Hyperionvirus sp.]
MAKSLEAYNKLKEEAESKGSDPPPLHPHSPTKAEYCPKEIELYLLTANESDAVKVCKPFLSKNAHACYALGNYFKNKNDIVNAWNYYSLGRKLDDPNCYRESALITIDKETANKYFERYIEKSKDYKYCRNLGILNQDLIGHYAYPGSKRICLQRAVENYLKYVVHEKDFKYYEIIGDLLYEDTKYTDDVEIKKYRIENAIVSYKLFVHETKNTDNKFNALLGNLSYEIKEGESAIFYFERYLGENKFLMGDYQLIKKLAECYLGSDKGKALELYKELYKMNGDDNDVLYAICKIYSENADVGGIFNWFKIGVGKNIRDGKYMMALMYRKMNMRLKAKEVCLVAEREYRDAKQLGEVGKCQNLMIQLIIESDD